MDELMELVLHKAELLAEVAVHLDSLQLVELVDQYWILWVKGYNLLVIH